LQWLFISRLWYGGKKKRRIFCRRFEKKTSLVQFDPDFSAVIAAKPKKFENIGAKTSLYSVYYPTRNAGFLLDFLNAQSAAPPFQPKGQA
jgi:hypothetical protein